MEQMLQDLLNVVTRQQQQLTILASKIQQIKSIGGGGSGNATISDYESGKEYKRNTLIVDPNTETVYRVLTEYISDTVVNDLNNNYIKLVGYESQVLTVPHNPTSSEIAGYPDDVLVAVYNPTDTPYTPDT